MSDTQATSSSHDGGCTCRHVRYRMMSKPLIVHCCHCSWCQRETGSAFALNAMIEADRVRLLTGDVVVVDLAVSMASVVASFLAARAPPLAVC